MSCNFFRVKHLEYETDAATFSLSDCLYNLLIGDNEMPMSSSGAFPVVVRVKLTMAASVLYLTKKVDLDYLREKLDNYDYGEVCTMTTVPYRYFRSIDIEIAIEEEQDQLDQLLVDFNSAIERKDGSIHYYVS